MTRALAALLLVAACNSGGSGGEAKSRVDLPQPSDYSSDDLADAAPVVAPPDAAPPPPPLEGADFTAEALMLYRIAACGGDAPLPAHVDAGVVERHCKRILEQANAYRDRYFVGGRAFFDELVPDDAPHVVVYPFGGGDLISALVAFPDATEITTISLELAGDPRRIATIAPDRLEASLGALRVEIGGMLQVGSNTSENLSASQDNDLPAQVSSFLMALVAGGYEPVGMRYFRLTADGAIDYLDADEIAAIETAKQPKASKRKGTWVSPSFSEAFAHVELRYRKLGDAPGVVRVHRHLGWNLHDTYLAEHPELLHHIAAKGKVTMMTKGASYLLWQDGFSAIRNTMIAGLAWMVSDSTGIPPQHAKAANLVQETYGAYAGAFLPTALGTRHDRDFVALWAAQPKRKVPFRFGYLDAGKRGHLVVTKPAAP